MSIEEAKKRVNQALSQLTISSSLDTSRNKILTELQLLLNQESITFPKLSQYKKLVKLFEYERMLQSANLCQ
jgi:hypothetical protein